LKSLNNNINYVLDLIIAVFLSFSIVYALSITWEMTYSAKDVLILVSLVSVGYSIALANRLSLRIIYSRTIQHEEKQQKSYPVIEK